MTRVLALTTDGELTYCTAPPEARGKGRCRHIDHMKSDETQEEFIERISEKIHKEDYDSTNDENTLEQEEINDLASKIDEIAGCKVTPENIDEVLSRLYPHQINEINKIAFDAAPEFALPISNEGYGEADTENNLYFAELPTHGVAGKKTSMEQMFVAVGEVPGYEGEMVNIEGNYLKGLTADEYFEKQYSARAAQISKSVSTAKPGYTARKLFYGLSDMQVKESCGSDSSTGVLDCKVPGGICQACLKKQGVNIFKPGDLIGGIISTNASERLTELSMKSFHTGGKDLNAIKERDTIYNTYDGFKTSPIIERALEAKTTGERRKIIFEGLRDEYAKNGLAVDDYNLMLIAKKMTSYKRAPMRYANDDELCDIVSLQSIGNNSNPFKNAELTSSYKIFTKPQEFDIVEDAATKIIFE